MKHIKYNIDPDGIAFITWDVENSAVNIMNADTLEEFFTRIGEALQDNTVKGIVINSAKNDFISGGDLKWLRNFYQFKKDI